MGRSQETFNKKEVRKRKEKKRKEKAAKRLARKENNSEGSQDDMIAYVDEFGNITSSPPDPADKKKVKAEDIEIGVPPKEDEPDSTTDRIGKVAHYNHNKGYGFITDSESHQNIFVHANSLIDPIDEGDTVSFVMGSGPKGPVANNVKLVK